MRTLFLSIAFILAGSPSRSAEPGQVIDVWPGKPPGETKEIPPEVDIAKPDDKPVGDRRIQKITNVSKPTLAIYRPAKSQDTGAAIVVLPGGGHHILAYDHEGTETAEWLAKIGVTGMVLKYRVPFRDKDKPWLDAVQDAQRAVSLVRSRAEEWGIDPKRIGILGFSAGGETAALTAILHVDKVSDRPDFAILIYPGGLLEKDNSKLKEYAHPTTDTPPMFMAHAWDDPVDVRNCLFLGTELKALKISTEMHMYATGGHGYGMRKTGHPVNTWPDRCQEWLTKQGYLKK
jgi:acetyl esterase/lipase